MANSNNNHLFGVTSILFAVFLIFALGMTILSSVQQTNSVTNASGEQPVVTTMPQQ